ncbi:response regulator transcription factor [Desertivirga arenae]|uniref:response regulator transcription factor n=1 Tax=Desertivirga arenae TaxID=2810309 RepID=UPI001A976E1E|nr:response regulator [Pedobacter sp. SYSU D00823]
MKRIFVLEKDSDILSIISLILHEEGFVVEGVKTVQELRGLLEKRKPNAILLDVISPYFEEAEFCKSLKSSKISRDIPIIVLSTNNQVKEALAKVCADDVISKPFDLNDLISSVKNQLVA